MKLIYYSADKNELLKESRGIGFEEVLLCIEKEYLMFTQKSKKSISIRVSENDLHDIRH